MQSDPEFMDSLDDKLLELNNQQKTRYLSLKKSNMNYKRPRAKQVAHNMNLAFLYKYSYDIASTHIHPMANDGEEAFLMQIGDLDHPRHLDHVSVLQNSYLVHVLPIQEGLIASERKWIGIIPRLLDEILSFLRSGREDYKLTFVELGKLGPGIRLSDEKSR